MVHNSKIIAIYQDDVENIYIKAPVCERQALEIARVIRDGCTVVLNLERCDPKTSRRLLDFVSGASYAREHQIVRIAVSAYLVTPPGVSVTDAVGRAM